jgi:hypothetical protein
VATPASLAVKLCHARVGPAPHGTMAIVIIRIEESPEDGL